MPAFTTGANQTIDCSACLPPRFNTLLTCYPVLLFDVPLSWFQRFGTVSALPIVFSIPAFWYYYELSKKRPRTAPVFISGVF